MRVGNEARDCPPSPPRELAKDLEWRQHADELCAVRHVVGGAVCQSRFLSSRTAVPLFREEAKSTSCAADECGLKVEGGTAMMDGRGRRCGEAEQGGTWRYCFERMKWVLDPNERGMDDERINIEETTTAAPDQASKLLARIAQLENLLRQHGIPVPRDRSL